jgi:hypothetical protein
MSSRRLRQILKWKTSFVVFLKLFENVVNVVHAIKAANAFTQELSSCGYGI